jgi:RNA polymerase sigma factor (sigma-70 family)
MKDKDSVEDMTQEVFIRIYKSLASFNPEFKFSTWSARIAKNLCLDELRKKKLTCISIDEYEGYAKDADSPEKRYVINEYKHEIQNLIDELPLKYKALIVLYHKKGLSYKEMAEKLGEPISIIKNRLFRARVLLKEKLLEAKIA